MSVSTATANLLDQFVERAGSLYSLPAVALEVLELTSQPRIDTRALKACVERDPALTSRLLRVVNSSLFGMSREVTDLNQALALLGVKPLKLLVLGFSLPKTLYAGIDAEELQHFWRFTLLKAVAARELSQKFWKGVGDESFIAGLLQDIGMLVLAQELGESYLSFLHGVREQRANLLQLETETLGFDHTTLSARLLDRWSLPASLVEAIGTPAPMGDGACLPAGESPLPRILHLATLIASILVDDRDDLLPQLLHAADRYRSIQVELGAAPVQSRSYCSTRSIVTRSPLVPGATAALTPDRSPLAGAALPLAETRASTTTSRAFEIVAPGAIAIESSSANSNGSSRAVRRRIASGIREPCAARAYTNSVASGGILDASAGAISTRPVIRLAAGAAAEGWGDGRAAAEVNGAGDGVPPS